MRTRELGGSGISVGPLAFGGDVSGWTADEATSFRLLDASVDAGFNLIDTADVKRCDGQEMRREPQELTARQGRH